MIRLIVNGLPREIAENPETRLVNILRDTLGLGGTRYGCGQGRCGVCTVMIGGKAMRSCGIPLRAVAGKSITTIEGIGLPERPTPIQAAVREAQDCQCGHCASGIIVSVTALLTQTPRPTEAQLREVVAGHQCMCGSRSRVIRAVMRVAGIPSAR
jgi:nicotinate dehydrogenase subunit A